VWDGTPTSGYQGRKLNLIAAPLASRRFAHLIVICMSFDLTTTFPTLAHAPITKAIIDIRTELPTSVTLRDLSDFAVGLETRFVKRMERHSFETRIEFQQGSTPRVIPSQDQPDGFVFEAPAEFLIAQARLDGFSLSRLNPYHDGDTFMSQATELWNR
jgi:uncharacterized protein (TIGR04255 family)